MISITNGKVVNAGIQAVRDIEAEHNKEIVIMETAYPFTTGWNDHYNNIYTENPLEGFPYTVDIKSANLRS